MVVSFKSRCILGYIVTDIACVKYKNELQSEEKAFNSPDIILELYHELFDEFEPPKIIHSDMNPNYLTKKKYFEENEVSPSLTLKSKQNQVVEAYNNNLKYYCIQFIFDKLNHTKEFLDWRATLDRKYTKMSIKQRASNKEFSSI